MKIKYVKPGENYPANLIKLGYSPHADLHLKEGITYIVYGISIWRHILHYLIIPTDEMLPSWLPGDLFEVVDPRLPFEWYFRYFGVNDPSKLEIEMGYKEIVLDKMHSINLIEREKDAIRTFLTRKREIDEES